MRLSCSKCGWKGKFVEDLRNHQKTHLSQIQTLTNRPLERDSVPIIIPQRVKRTHRRKYPDLTQTEMRVLAMRAITTGSIDKVKGNEVFSCASCGCLDIRTLQINHLNGDGQNHSKRARDHRELARGLRSTKDFNILCSVCNYTDFIQKKYGLKYKITLLEA